VKPERNDLAVALTWAQHQAAWRHEHGGMGGMSRWPVKRTLCTTKLSGAAGFDFGRRRY